MAYAETTTVEVKNSIGETVNLVKKAGAVRVAQIEEPDSFTIEFILAERRVRFRVILPTLAEIPTTDGRGRRMDTTRRAGLLAQRHRQRARALLLVIKAKLESVESQVETFEQAFLANVVMGDGTTVHDRISAPIAREYAGGAPMALLAGPSRPQVSCPRLSGPSTMIVWIAKGTTNAEQEAQAGRDHREAA